MSRRVQQATSRDDATFYLCNTSGKMQAGHSLQIHVGLIVSQQNMVQASFCARPLLISFSLANVGCNMIVLTLCNTGGHTWCLGEANKWDTDANTHMTVVKAGGQRVPLTAAS